MKFDIVIGNPPYQKYIKSGYNGAKSIYNDFIDLAYKFNNYVCMIIPSRWMTDTPNGISISWLYKMRTSKEFMAIVDYYSSTDVFNDVKISGGVCYFLIKVGTSQKCNIISIVNNQIHERIGYIAFENDIIIRDSIDIDILNKIKVVMGNDYIVNKSFSSLIGSTRAFGISDKEFNTNWEGYRTVQSDIDFIRYKANNKLKNNGNGFVSEGEITSYEMMRLMRLYKMIIPITGPTDKRVINMPIILGENSCCSRSYTTISSEEIIKNEQDCRNIILYMKTVFFRYLVQILKKTQHAPAKVYSLVPILDFTKTWSDTKLNKLFNLTKAEIDCMNSKVDKIEI